MSRWVNVSLVLLLMFAFLPATSVQAQTTPVCDIEGVQASGALFCIDEPHAQWNGGLVIFAHGYVAVNEPLVIPWSQMTFVDAAGNTVYMPDILNDMGFAFATSSYSVNGLAVQQGVEDIRDLIDVFTQVASMPPAFVLLVGASEGGLVTTLAVERHPDQFAGGLALCGPIGSFTGQVNYWGDFRVLFDYFMDLPRHDILPGTAISIPESLMTNWESVYAPRVLASLIFRPFATKQLMTVSKAPYDKADNATIAESSLGILWYNVFATNDAVEKLGGSPFDNHNRKYKGSYSDYWLNRRVARFTADPAALAEIAANYETSGVLVSPLVTMHTTGDPIVPAWHQTLYAKKVLGNNPLSPYLSNEVSRYGHCSFTLAEVENGFGLLAALVMGQQPVMVPMTSIDSSEAQSAGDTYYYDYH